MVRTNYIRALTLFAIALAAWLIVTAVWEDPAEARKRKSGTWIVFASDRDGDLEIFRIKPDGTGLKQLTFNNVPDKQPVLSPNGRKIAYSSPGKIPVGNDLDDDIFVMNADGTGTPTNLTNNDQGDGGADTRDQSPDWSPDGTKIAYTSVVESTSPLVIDNDFEIYDMDASNGQNRRPLTSDPANDPHSDFRPDYSPQGDKIAFSRFVGDVEIFVMDANGNNEQPLTNNATFDFRPKFSPDGKKILYDSCGTSTLNSDADFEVLVMNADGTGTDNLTDNDTDDLMPDYSPNGEKIVYNKLPRDTNTCFFSPTGENGNLHTMRANGTDKPGKSLTKTDGNTSINQSPDWGRKPR